MVSAVRIDVVDPQEESLSLFALEPLNGGIRCRIGPPLAIKPSIQLMGFKRFIVCLESLSQPELRFQHDIADHGTRCKAVIPEDPDQGRHARRQTAYVIDYSVGRRIERCEDRGMRGQSGRRLRYAAFKVDGFFRKCVDCGRCLSRIAVTSQVIGPERVNRYEHDIGTRRAPRTGLRNREDEQEQENEQDPAQEKRATVFDRCFHQDL